MKSIYRVYKNKIGAYHCEKHVIVDGDENVLYLKVHGTSKRRAVNKSIRFEELIPDLAIMIINDSLKELYFNEQPDMGLFDKDEVVERIVSTRECVKTLNNRIKLYERLYLTLGW